MADRLKLQILSPERRLLNHLSVGTVTLPGSEGQIQILPGHAPMVGTLETGVFSYSGAEGGKADESGVVSTGFFEVFDDTVTVLAETIEFQSEINVGRAKTAQKKAEEMLTHADIDEHSFKKYQLKLQRSLLRQHVSGKSASEE